MANVYILLKERIHSQNRIDSNRIINNNGNVGFGNHIPPFPRRQRKNYITNYCFNILTFNLAISDLFGCIYLIILAAADLHYRKKLFWNDSTDPNHRHSRHEHREDHCARYNLTNPSEEWVTSISCHMARILYIAATTQSVNIILCIAIERYICICYPSQFHNMITAFITKLAVGFGWLLALLMSILIVIFAKLTWDSNDHIRVFSYRYHNLCIFDNIQRPFIRILLVIQYTICMIIYGVIISLYIAITLKLKWIRQSGSIMFNAAKGEKNVLAVAIATGATNLLCWFPGTFTAFGIMISWPSIKVHHLEFIRVSPVLILLFPANCCLNPILHVFITSKFGRKLIHGKSNYAAK
ncbi:expressed hypothetical protein [Trichoplax adhaerens]|uniref:G-protein coupled receptors family 1 profile domain-containing protein n=1 Tax=Trichoplax adhaerens TaxID=10228 RepID=B3RZF4_TRIAD|nr:expressed hypothetical protein [Trichoplax adhaerens]EDV24193.1 expressed hypothetical protein [Trichoplax adhaerens]|eukprot:XP_002113719.1 expressed hypothetical protein [Trichoplax adhaerens]